MERIAVTDGLTLATVLDRVTSGARLILTRDDVEVAALVRPDDLSDATTAYLVESIGNINLSALLAELESPARLVPAQVLPHT